MAEQNREVVESLRKSGIPAVSGDASESSVLIQAHIANASMLVVATADVIDVGRMVDTAKTLKPDIQIVLRAHNEEESALLRKDGLGKVFYSEEELAIGMCKFVVEQFKLK